MKPRASHIHSQPVRNGETDAGRIGYFGRLMKAVNMIRESLLDNLDDVPPPPPSYTQYVERTMHDRIQAAYERGVAHGSRYRIGILLLGMLFGWVAGVSATAMP